MALQTLRHHIDFAFHEADDPVSSPPASTAPPASKSPTYWARKIIVLPIGERWALIALLTALTTPRTTFVALLIWGLIAAAYTTAGRVQRSLARTAPRSPQAVASLYAMSDLLARPRAEVSRLSTRLGWLVPPIYHAFDYAIPIAFATEVHGALPLTFAYLAAVMYHHYDVVYRIRAHAAAPRWITVAGLGTEGRIVLLVLANLLPTTPAHHGLLYAFGVLAVYLWVLFLGESVHFWVRPTATALLPAD